MKMLIESCLSCHIRGYLEMKQALGRQFSQESRVLQQLNEFMVAITATDLTQSEFEEWCKTQKHLCATVRRNRMRIVRNLCLYRSRREPNCFIPDRLLFPALSEAVRPHIYSEAEIVRILEAAGQLCRVSRCPLRPNVFRLAIVLLYTCGLRRQELARLSLNDYDQKEKTLHIRETKFHKSRYVPLSPDASRELDAYLSVRRDLKSPMLASSALLWNLYRGGKAYSASGLSRGIGKLLRAANVRKADGSFPRVHDFRHAFALQALLRWYRAGVDIQSKLPLLATYMGHVSILSTEYYLSFIPELAAEASHLFCTRYGELVKPLVLGGVS
jgi:integrase